MKVNIMKKYPFLKNLGITEKVYGYYDGLPNVANGKTI